MVSGVLESNFITFDIDDDSPILGSEDRRNTFLKERQQPMKELKIDPELRDLLPPLADDEYKQLEKNIVDNGFDRNFPIMEWHGFIVDGHNRYSICRKHNIDYTVGTLAYETKEEVMRWMLDIQLGRRNLTPIQRILVAEKHKALYVAQAKENLKQAGTNYGIGMKKPLPNLVTPPYQYRAYKTWVSCVLVLLKTV